MSENEGLMLFLLLSLIILGGLNHIIENGGK
jgi:hypothetical protein